MIKTATHTHTLGNVTVYFPPKRAFHNMDKTFIESRAKELENYLQVAILSTVLPLTTSSPDP